jgi:hypothetical protein
MLNNKEEGLYNCSGGAQYVWNTTKLQVLKEILVRKRNGFLYTIEITPVTAQVQIKARRLTQSRQLALTTAAGNVLQTIC